MCHTFDRVAIIRRAFPCRFREMLPLKHLGALACALQVADSASYLDLNLSIRRLWYHMQSILLFRAGGIPLVNGRLSHFALAGNSCGELKFGGNLSIIG